jgi:hypothetical protein
VLIDLLLSLRKTLLSAVIDHPGDDVIPDEAFERCAGSGLGR